MKDIQLKMVFEPTNSCNYCFNYNDKDKCCLLCKKTTLTSPETTSCDLFKSRFNAE